MSVLAAGELCREHLRQARRLAWDVVVLKNVAEGRADTLYASYAARIRHEREVWIDGLTSLADRLDDLLDVDGATAYAQASWRPIEPATKAWRTIRKQQSESGWQSPNADEVAARLVVSQPHTDAWIMGALQVYLSMALQTSEEAGTMSLRHLGKGVTWEWADPRVMARDLYQVRGSKIVQQMYGNHVDRLRDIILSATDPRHPRTLQQVRAYIKEAWPALRAHQIDRIARTETATIWTHTSMQAYAANGVEHWESTIAHGPTIGVDSEDPCHECIAEAIYLHDMAGDWPPWHPNCRCEAVPIFENPDTGEVWLPPDEPWAGGAGVGQELAIVEGTEAALARVPKGDGPLLSPAPLPGERMSFRATTQTATAPYKAPRRGTHRTQTYTPEGDVRAMITSCNNKISGLKTRIKAEEAKMAEGGLFDHTKLNDLRARLSEQYRLRAELKMKLGELPPPQPPPVVPPKIPDKPWALDDTKIVYDDVIADYNGQTIRITWESGGTAEGVVARSGEYWLVEGQTIGTGRGVTLIEVRFGDRWVKVAERPVASKLDEVIATDWGSNEATLFARAAARDLDKGVPGFTLQDASGKLSGIVSYTISEGVIRVENLASAIRGAGSRLMMKVAEEAAARGYGVELAANPGAVGFYTRLGMTQDALMFRWTAEEASLFARTGLRPSKTVEELKAEMTSARNKISGLKTRHKRELEKFNPRFDVVRDIEQRVGALERDIARIRAELDKTKQLPPPSIPVEPPVGPTSFRQPPEPPVTGGAYLERGPGTSPLVDELAEVRAELQRRLAAGRTDDLDAGVRLTIKAGERIQKELDAQDLKYLDEAVARAEAERASVQARGAEIDRAVKDAEIVYDNKVRPYKERLASERYGRRWDDLSYTERNQLDAALNQEPVVVAARKELVEIRSMKSRWYDDSATADRAVSQAEETKLVAERVSLKKILDGVRDIGPAEGARLRYSSANTTPKIFTSTGKLKARSFEKTKKVLEDAQQWFPRAWLRLQRPADAGWVSRGWHKAAYGGEQEIRISSRAGKVTTDRDGLSVAIHEMGHEVEDTVAGIIQLERRFYEYRTGSEQPKRLGRGYGKDEVTKEDEFLDPYMGKYYGYQSYEVLTMGLESIWTGSFRLDPEMRSFILGLLALV